MFFNIKKIMREKNHYFSVMPFREIILCDIILDGISGILEEKILHQLKLM